MVVIISFAVAIVLLKVVPRPSNDPPVIDSMTGDTILYYSNRYKLITGIIPIQISLTLYYFFFVRLSGEPDMVVRFELWLMTLVPFLSGLWEIAKGYSCRIVLRNDSIVYHHFIFKPQSIEWQMISTVSCSKHSVEICSISGHKIQVSDMMNGFSTFVKTMIPKLSPTVAQKATIELKKYQFAA